MANTTQNVSTIKNTVTVNTGTANKKLRDFKKLLASFKSVKMPNISASVTGMTATAKKNAKDILKSQKDIVIQLEKQAKAYNYIIQKQRKSLDLARRIRSATGAPSGGGGGGGSRGNRGSSNMGPPVPAGVRNTNRLNTSIERVEGLSGSRGMNLDSQVNGRSIRSIGNAFRGTTQSAAAYRHEIARVTAELRRARSATTGLGESMRRLRTYVVAATASMTLFTAGKDIVRKGLQIEGLQIALKSITGDAKKAATEYQFFRSVVQMTGVDMIAAAKGFKQLTASAVGTKLAGEGVHDIFSEVSKQAAVLGMTADDTNGVFRAFSQIISKAKVSAEELNSQLGDRMFGAVQIAARGMKMTTKELLKLVSTGKLTAEEFIPKFMSALKDMNSGFKEAAEISKQVAFNRFNNGLTDMKVAIFQGGLGQGLKDLANGFAKMMIMGGPLATFLGGTLKGLVIGITAPFAILAGVLIDVSNAFSRLAFGKKFIDLENSEKDALSMTGVITGLVIGLGILAKVVTLVAGAAGLLASPFILVIGAIAAATAGIYAYRNEIAALMKEYLGDDIFDQLGGFSSLALDGLLTVVTAIKDVVLETLDAFKELSNISMPEIFSDNNNQDPNKNGFQNWVEDKFFRPDLSDAVMSAPKNNYSGSGTTGANSQGVPPQEFNIALTLNEGPLTGFVAAAVTESKENSILNIKNSITA
jgi:tape measure domain-containing protein